MGRELKRVPMDFGWKIGKIWEGYSNPFGVLATECEGCGGTGYSPEARRLNDQWYGYAPFRPEDRGSRPFAAGDPMILRRAERSMGFTAGRNGLRDEALVRESRRLADLYNSQWCHHCNEDDIKALLDAGRLMDFTHVPRSEKQRAEVVNKVEEGGNSWLPESNGYVPTPEEVNDWSLRAFGHDSINRHVVVAAECVRLGVPRTCGKCKGHGALWPSPEIEKQYEEWEGFEPPAGEGYQLWETVSEGSPISPVFNSPEELAAWLSTSPDYTWRQNDEGTTYEQWMAFLTGPGECPSMVSKGGEILTGVQACSH